MSLRPYLCIVGRGDIPIFESGFDQSNSSTAHKDELIQFVLHGALDALEHKLVVSNSLLLKNIGKHNDWSISAYVTAGYAKFLLLHPPRLDENTMRLFFSSVHELYVKAIMNPFSEIHVNLVSPAFEERVLSIAQRTILK